MSGGVFGELPPEMKRESPSVSVSAFFDAGRACRVYWGSHGCRLERGHEGPHECHCARDENGNLEPKEDEDGVLNVGATPYYGPETRFYGEDA